MDTDRQAAADTPPDPEPATPAYDEVLARGLGLSIDFSLQPACCYQLGTRPQAA